MKKSRTPETEPETLSKEQAVLGFPVVGIGASAGGLEALQEFFSAMPEDPGLGFVIVQHLAPDYKSLMNELLGRVTRMQIQNVESGMHVEKDHIYLIPPGKNMTIFHGRLLLNDQKPRNELNLPIDIFLTSLAKDQKRNSIGIILSGTGSDGALGMRSIKEYGGVAMVQDSRSAKFDGMPKSSIDTGVMDFILPPVQLADVIVNYVKHPFVSRSKELEKLLQKDEHQLNRLLSILREKKNLDFTDYKENTILRRLEKRISLNRLQDIREYISVLEKDEKEVDILYNDLLIGVTRFFRDQDAFKKLEDLAIPELFKSEPGEPIRVWVTGCSTGEEAYSLGILISEYARTNALKHEVKIFATDVDERALEYAGAGFYPTSIASTIPQDLLQRYFVAAENGYKVNDRLRTMIIFARHDILQDPPFSKVDLISCRNLLIYLNPTAQQRVFGMLYMALRNQGILFLGSSEAVGEMADGFKVLETRSKIFQKKPGFTPPHVQLTSVLAAPKLRFGKDYVNRFSDRDKERQEQLYGIFDQVLSHRMPPTLIINDAHELVHSINDVSRYVSLPKGTMSLDVFKMMDRELGLTVSNLLRRLNKTRGVVTIKNIVRKNGDREQISISGLAMLHERKHRNYYMISFEEAPSTGLSEIVESGESLDARSQYLEKIEELEQALQFKSENLQATVEELETSNEELQSSNEELIASNEELQSTNEELQSVNEELYTVNAELLQKIDEVTQLSADLENLQMSAGIGTLYFDQHLVIRKADTIAQKITHIRARDIGRALTELSLESLYDKFLVDVEKVFKTLKPIGREIYTEELGWFQVKIVPFRTAENAVDGIIVTFNDINDLKSSKAQVHTMEKEIDRYHVLFETLETGIVFQSRSGEIYDANPAAEEILGLSLSQMQGRTSLHPKWKAVREDGSDFPGSEHPAMVALETGEKQIGVIMGVFHPPKNEHRWIQVDAMPIFAEGAEEPHSVYASFVDITEERTKET